MKYNVWFDEDGYIISAHNDPNGEYEIQDFEVEYFNCYHLVDGEIVLDADKKEQVIAQREAQMEIGELQQKLNDTDYIIARTFEEIMALNSSITFIADFIKILKNFRNKYAAQLSQRKAWRSRIEELKGE